MLRYLHEWYVSQASELVWGVLELQVRMDDCEVLKPEMTQVRQLWYTQLVEICVSLVV